MNAHAGFEHDMEGEAPDIELETMFGDCRDAMLSRMKHMKTSWPLLNEAEQAEIINGLEMAAKHIVRGAVRAVTKHEFPHAVVELGEVKIGGSKGIEAKISCQNIELNRNVLGDHVGQMVPIVMIDSDQFMGQREPATAEPDQADWLRDAPAEEPEESEPRGLPKPEDFE